jgi:hypothetical protein
MQHYTRRRVHRDEFLNYVLPHSDPVKLARIVDRRNGTEATLYRSETGHVLGEAVYPPGNRALYRIKIAH